jgi:hypothetical protein
MSFTGLQEEHECGARSSTTMYRVGRDGVIINWTPCTPDDTIVLAYGEVDCRANIGKQIALGRLEDEIITELTSAYIKTVRAVVAEGHVIVVAVIPPTTSREYSEENPDGGFPFESSDEERVRYTKKVNNSLSILCEQAGFVFFNPYIPYTREDGCLRRELSDMNIHVGNPCHVLTQFKPAFIIPVYPGDYKYLEEIRNLPPKREYDIVVVLTYHSDKSTLNTKNIDVVLVLEDFVSPEQMNVISSKKLYAIAKTYFAMKSLSTRYTYFACVDCEIKFKNCKSVFAKIAERYQDNSIVGCTLNNTADHEHAYECATTINRQSAQYFSNDERNTLSRLTNEFRFYSWFSDIPIYRSDTSTDFLRHIGFDDINKWLEQSTVNFHWIPYSYYRILYEGARIVDMKTRGILREWSLECMPAETYKKVCAAGFVPLWVVNSIYDSSMTNCVLTYHCDRTSVFFGAD